MNRVTLLFAVMVTALPAITHAQGSIFQDGFESGDTGAWSAAVGVIPLQGFGEISGACGVLTPANLDSASPQLFTNALDFGTDPYDDADLGLLTSGGQKIISDANSGGSSVLANVFAFEVLARCELAALLKTEEEIIYLDPVGRKTTLLVEIDQLSIGVSVTRAVTFPYTEPFTVQQANDLLVEKLGGINESSANVAPADAWRKQVLSILAYGPGHAASIATAWALISPALRADTMVIVTVTDGDDSFLY